MVRVMEILCIYSFDSVVYMQVCVRLFGQKALYLALFSLYGAVHSPKTKWSCNRVNEKQQRMPDKTSK